MGDKVIYLAGRPIPIRCDAAVHTYMDGGMSFYNPQTAGVSNYGNMMMRRPSGRVYSNRRGVRGARHNLDMNTFAKVSTEEFDELRDTLFQVVLHHDVTFSSEDCFGVLVSRGLSTHFLINHDGTLHEALDPYHSAWATGDNNNNCISLDLNNPVKLELADKDPANPPRQVFQGNINRSMKVMLGYTEAQYATFIALLRALITPLKLEAKFYWIPLPVLGGSCFPPMNAEGEVITRMLANSTEFVGFLGHYHCSANKWDPGPAFDWMKVLAGVHGERNSFPVLMAGGKNLPDLMGQGLTDELNRFYDNIEGDETGGWYPIGANQTWHSGVHLHIDEGTPVYAMSKGTIVAIRNVNRVDLGDASFVLIRHEMAEEAVVVEGEEAEPKYWFSLYMHLHKLRGADELTTVPWVNTLLGGDFNAPTTDDYSFDTDANAFPREKRNPIVADGISPTKFAKETKLKPFYDGDIILVEIPVASGEKIGVSGVFGQSEWSQEPQVHVEVISGKNVFGDLRPGAGREWILVEGDLDNNSLVDIEKVLSPIAKSAVSFDGEKKERVLKTSEIQTFFVDGSTETARTAFRKMICVHRSEWSSTMDWSKTATSAVGWQWETQEAFSRWLMTWIPFRWMTAEVAAHAALPEDHQVFTYHPLTFLDTLNKSYTGGGQANAEEASDEQLSEAEAAEEEAMNRVAEISSKISAGETLTEEEQVEYDELYAQMDAHMGSNEADVLNDDMLFNYDGSFDSWEPGEWDPPKKKKGDESMMDDSYDE